MAPWRTFPGARWQGQGPRPWGPDWNQMTQGSQPGGAMSVNGADARLGDRLRNPDGELATDPDGRVVHLPVARQRVVTLLGPALTGGDAIYVDATLGMAGHASAVLAAHPTARLIGLDRDADALSIADEVLAERYAGRYHLVQARFDELDEVLGELRIVRVHAVLADLGLSSLQIAQPARGFSYARDVPLDMRMDSRTRLTAAEVLNCYPIAELRRILQSYGEQPYAGRIAEAIVAERVRSPFRNSARLVEVITAALPAGLRHGAGHPAKRVFQALRIEVNGELDALAGLLSSALAALAVDGRMAVLAYHSLEDGMVKQAFAAACSDTAPPRLPMVPECYRARFRHLTRGAEKADPTEIAVNRRASSARLRAVQRIRPDQPEANR